VFLVILGLLFAGLARWMVEAVNKWSCQLACLLPWMTDSWSACSIRDPNFRTPLDLAQAMVEL
jgi:hypothetical protein